MAQGVSTGMQARMKTDTNGETDVDFDLREWETSWAEAVHKPDEAEEAYPAAEQDVGDGIAENPFAEPFQTPDTRQEPFTFSEPADAGVDESQVTPQHHTGTGTGADTDTAHEPPDEALANLALAEPVPPNGGYGWVCTLAVFLVNAHTWGVNASWAVIMAHYTANPGTMAASHLELGLVGGLSISQALLISPLVNLARRRIGARWSQLIGSVLIFASLLSASFATRIWHLVLSQGLCFGWGMGFSYVTASNVLPAWFSSRRSLAVGLATSGAGIGGILYSIAADRLIQTLSVAWAYRVLAVCALVANLLAALLLRDLGASPSHASHPASGAGVRFNPRDFQRAEVLLIVLWGLSTELGYIILLYSLPSYAASINLTPSQGSLANAMLNLGLALGRPPVGYFSDRFGRITMAGILTLACAVLCFVLWIPATSLPPLLAFALVAGMLCGTFWCTVTPVLAEVVGVRNLASTFGVICLGLVLPTTFAEPVAMKLAGAGNSFTRAQIFAGFMFFLGSLALWMLRCWKIFTVNEDEAGTSRRGARVSWIRPAFMFSTRRV